jgi:hypothetical protein
MCYNRVIAHLICTCGCCLSCKVEHADGCFANAQEGQMLKRNAAAAAAAAAAAGVHTWLLGVVAEWQHHDRCLLCLVLQSLVLLCYHCCGYAAVA